MSNDPSQADSQRSRLRRLAHRLAEEDPNPELSRRARVLMTVGPVAGFGLILLAGFLVKGYKASGFLATMEVLSFVGGGKFVIFGGVSAKAPLGIWALAGLVMYGDTATAVVMMANMTLLYRTPRVGRWLASCHEAGWYVLRANPWMRRVAWLGVALFVAAPFQGTGAVVGTIVARILGMSRLSTLTATVAGSGIGCSAVALLGVYARKRVAAIVHNPLIAGAVFLLVITTLVIVGRRFTGKALRQAEPAGDPPREP